VEKGENSAPALSAVANWQRPRGPKLFCGGQIAAGEAAGVNGAAQAGARALRVQWSPEHNPAVEDTGGRTKDGSLPRGRNVSFADPAYQSKFKDWLTKKGVAYEVVSARGNEYVVWDEAARGDLLQEFSKQLAEPCPRRKRTC
jgi:hypothetical protein